jgi:hypothetical protein
MKLPKHETMKIFKQTLRALGPLPDDQMDQLMYIAHLTHIGKGEHFLRAGDIPKQIGFNLKGLYIQRKTGKRVFAR